MLRVHSKMMFVNFKVKQFAKIVRACAQSMNLTLKVGPMASVNVTKMKTKMKKVKMKTKKTKTSRKKAARANVIMKVKRHTVATAMIENLCDPVLVRS